MSRAVLTLVGWAALVIAAGGCRDEEPVEAGEADAAVHQPQPPASVQAPAPPAALEVPEAIAEHLPRTEEGLPIVGGVSAGGVQLSLSYDATLDDPITRWAACLERVVACGEANEPAALAGCIATIDVCQAPEGGEGCCPVRCLEDFDRQRTNGLDDAAAIERVFLRGDCVAGYAEVRGEAAGTLQP